MTKVDSTNQISGLNYNNNLNNQKESLSLHKNEKPFFFVGFEGSRHLQPERLPTSNLTVPNTIQLLETNQNTIQCFSSVSSHVLHFSARGLGLKSLPTDLIRGMKKLKKIDLGKNCLTNSGLPCSMGDLRNLVEIRLASNKIRFFPSCLSRLKNLKRLDLSDNSLTSLAGIEHLKQLQFLILDNNKLQTIFPEIKQLKFLQFLYCSGNSIRQIEVDIQYLKSLQVLEMANNRLVSIPVELFNLPNLESLNVSNNLISKLPTFHIRFQNRNLMAEIDLSNNNISNFPERLLLLAKKIDLDTNKIKVLNSKVLSRLSWHLDQQLILKDNPLIYPPADICGGGLNAMLQFFVDEQAEKKTQQGIKIMVLGSYSCGKTSLVQSFIAQQSQLQEKPGCTGGVDIYDVNVDRQYEFMKESSVNVDSLQLSIWDFCGDYRDFHFHYLFYQKPSVTLLCFDAFQFKESQDFSKMIGCWLDWIISRTNQLNAILVATRSDLLDGEELLEVTNQVKCQKQSYLRKHKRAIEDEMKAISQSLRVSAALSNQLKSYVDLLQAKITIANKVIPISSAEMTGFSGLYECILNSALNKEQFPNVSRAIPTFWLEIGSFLEEKGNDLEFPVMEWNRYTTLITTQFGMKHLIYPVTQYLHDMGKILWFSKHDRLKDYVFLRPSWITGIFRQIVNAASGQFLEQLQEKGLKSVKLSKIRLEDMTHRLAFEGILSRQLLQLILTNMLSTDKPEYIDKIFDLLSKTFEVGYLLGNNSAQKANQDQPEVEKENTCLIIPWLRESPVAEDPEKVRSNVGISVAYQFKNRICVGIFELLVCRLCNIEDFALIKHWRDEIEIQHSSLEGVVRVARQGEGLGVIQSRKLIVSVRKMDSLDQLSQEESVSLWKTLLLIIMETEKVLESFPGELVKRLIACPFCEELVFVGEWLCPKELQNTAFQTCRNCQKDVATYLLIQPKQQTKADLIRQKLKEMSAKQNV